MTKRLARSVQTAERSKPLTGLAKESANGKVVLCGGAAVTAAALKLASVAPWPARRPTVPLAMAEFVADATRLKPVVPAGCQKSWCVEPTDLKRSVPWPTTPTE